MTEHEATLRFSLQDWHLVAHCVCAQAEQNPDHRELDRLCRVLGDVLQEVQNRAHAVEGAE